MLIQRGLLFLEGKKQPFFGIPLEDTLQTHLESSMIVSSRWEFREFTSHFLCCLLTCVFGILRRRTKYHTHIFVCWVFSDLLHTISVYVRIFALKEKESCDKRESRRTLQYCIHTYGTRWPYTFYSRFVTRDQGYSTNWCSRLTSQLLTMTFWCMNQRK